MLQPWALPRRRTCRRFLRLQPPSLVRESSPGWVGETCAPAWTAAGGKLYFRTLQLPNCSLALAKFPNPFRAPRFPFFLLGGDFALRAPWGACVPGCQRREETFAAREDCMSARAHPPLPSLPPRAPCPRISRRTLGARSNRELPGERERDPTQNPAGLRCAQVLQLLSRWALSSPDCS